jgi:KaiC/GvpD/RAD55 family RecA-like ATPase
MYNYWSQLVAELKQQDSVLFALAEDGMHPPNVLTTMEQIFDGVIEMRLYEEGLAITPLFRVKKMLGLPPLHGYFRFSVSNTGMEVLPHVR